MHNRESGRRGTSHLRDYGAVYILLALWLIFGVGQFLTNMSEYTSDQASHGQPFEWAGFLVYFLARLFENLQSEAWQLALQGLLVVAWADKVFRKGTEDVRRLEAKVDRLLERQ
jgi:hypothetical protein